jgi:hypothetical protein
MSIALGTTIGAMHLNGKRFAARLQAHLEPGEEVRGRFPVVRDPIDLYDVPDGDVVVTDRATLLWDSRLRLVLAGPLQSFQLDHTKRVSHLDLVGSDGECVRVWVDRSAYPLVDAAQPPRDPHIQ